MPDAPRSDVQRVRDRLNMLVLVLPGQWFGLMAVFWMRFLPPFRPFAFHVPAPPPLILVAGAAVCLVPFILPRGWFRPRGFERGGLYPALGVRLFRFLATDGEWVNRRLRRLDPTYRVVHNRATRAEHIAGTISNERWHSALFLFGLGTQVVAVVTAQYRWAVALTLANIVFNLYPVFHQRYKRGRLRQPLDPARGLTSSAPAVP